MPRKYTKIAIAYDFDGTLAPGYMQHNSFIPELGMSSAKFWAKVKKNAKNNDMDEILAYMHLMLEEAKYRQLTITKGAFIQHGKDIPLFNGVDTWFERINDYGKSKKIDVRHFVISSGLREMIEGSSIYKYFDYVFASGFKYDQNDVAIWPALGVNYTTKTQYLFRINKGVHNSWDNKAVNKYIPDSDRPIPFSNMIFIGDGETDVPSMKMIKYQGGTAIAVWTPGQRKSKNKKTSKEIAIELLEQDRAHLAVPADYKNGKQLDNAVKAIIDKVAASEKFKKQQK